MRPRKVFRFPTIYEVASVLHAVLPKTLPEQATSGKITHDYNESPRGFMEKWLMLTPREPREAPLLMLTG